VLAWVVLWSLGSVDIPLIEAGQTSAPVCIEYCTSWVWDGYALDVYRNCEGRWAVGLSAVV
jgi:hypothetical protein